VEHLIDDSDLIVVARAIKLFIGSTPEDGGGEFVVSTVLKGSWSQEAIQVEWGEMAPHQLVLMDWYILFIARTKTGTFAPSYSKFGVWRIVNWVDPDGGSGAGAWFIPYVDPLVDVAISDSLLRSGGINLGLKGDVVRVRGVFRSDLERFVKLRVERKRSRGGDR
jgi:hypothetical protein